MLLDKHHDDHHDQHKRFYCDFIANACNKTKKLNGANQWVVHFFAMCKQEGEKTCMFTT